MQKLLILKIFTLLNYYFFIEKYLAFVLVYIIIEL